MEDKQKILDLLLPALQQTNNLKDIESLTYSPENETVKAVFTDGRSCYANVALDSGTSMIRDVCYWADCLRRSNNENV